MRELLFSVTRKDFDVQTFRCSGHGGQKVNKTSSGVRIIHKESGAVGEGRDERSQYQNKKSAFKRLVNSVSFKMWLNKKVHEINIDKREIERQVDKEMRNILIEVREDNKFVPIK
ncbi:MAG: peptide chain release factor-like protein [Epsilonproteobacteria bacterium]|nr:peptide chain release factor-like protein [Campylobacterota bacterium]